MNVIDRPPAREDVQTPLETGRRLIEQEAGLLEEEKWAEWLDLYTEDCIFWVPSWRNDGTLTEDPETELSLIYYASRAGLEERIFRIKSPFSPASRPMARTTHLLANTRLIADFDGETIRLKSSWATHVFMTRTDSSHCFFGQVEHDLVRRPDGWRIARKKSILQNDYIPSIMDIYCL